MPCILMCGFPSSGKTERADKIRAHFINNDRACELISDNDFPEDKNDVYSNSQFEKQRRSNIKSALQRLVNKDSVIIVDSLNYIKGFRYELYCAIKSSQTPECVIFCHESSQQVKTWNDERQPEDRYTDSVLDGLIMRFEEPDSKNRWDSPLFVLHHNDVLPIKEIVDALFNKKAPPPNHSTLSQPISSNSFMFDLDRITLSVVNIIMETQKTCYPGDHIFIPGSTNKFILLKNTSMAELQRSRRKFISFTKTHPIDDTSVLANMFIEFLNNTCNQ